MNHSAAAEARLYENIIQPSGQLACHCSCMVGATTSNPLCSAQGCSSNTQPACTHLHSWPHSRRCGSCPWPQGPAACSSPALQHGQRAGSPHAEHGWRDSRAASSHHTQWAAWHGSRHQNVPAPLKRNTTRISPQLLRMSPTCHIVVQGLQDAAGLRCECSADLRKASLRGRAGCVRWGKCSHQLLTRAAARCGAQKHPPSRQPSACCIQPICAPLAWSKPSTWFIAAVEMTTSSNTGTEPPTSPVLPPCEGECKQG